MKTNHHCLYTCINHVSNFFKQTCCCELQPISLPAGVGVGPCPPDPRGRADRQSFPDVCNARRVPCRSREPPAQTLPEKPRRCRGGEAPGGGEAASGSPGVLAPELFLLCPLAQVLAFIPGTQTPLLLTGGGLPVLGSLPVASCVCGGGGRLCPTQLDSALASA